VIIAVTMVLGPGDPQHSAAVQGRDPLQIAVFPLAVPYLLNPAGIVTLVTLSGRGRLEKIFGVLLAALAVQLMLDGLDSVGVIHLSGH
jgi:multiple antibiotic resistance protein